VLLTLLTLLLFTLPTFLRANGQELTGEVRYFDAPGGKPPQRFRVTGPDGKVADLFEAQLSQVAGFCPPQSMRVRAVKSHQE
jgi:hypothetical protein